MGSINENDVLKESIEMMEEKLAQKLFLVNKKEVSKNAEIEKKANESIKTNNELSFQYKVKVNLAAELILANKELAFQYEEKEKRASELIIAKSELELQNKEKEKRAIELIIANKEQAFQKLEKTIRESELVIANKKLIYKTLKRQIKITELNIVNSELKIAKDKQKEYAMGLEELMFMTSHKVRQPIANILGLSNLLDQLIDSPEELKQTVLYIKEAALTLDLYTRELTAFICELGQNEKNIKKE